MKYITTINNTTFEIEINSDGTLLVNGEPREVNFLSFGDSALYSILMDGLSHEAVVEERAGAYEVLMQGRLFNVDVLDERAQRLASRQGGTAAETGEISLKSPMPGRIVAVPVTEGQEVKAGQTLVILESMKMENELKAPRDGVVQRISIETGQSVEQNKLLITMI